MGRVKVLLVEDDPVCARIYQAGLERGGCDVLHISDGRIAMERLCFTNFDVVVLDLMLPGMDGLEILERMRKLERHQDTSVFILSSVDLSLTRRVANQYGVLQFLNKQKDPPTQIVEAILYAATLHPRGPEECLRMAASDGQPMEAKCSQITPPPPPPTSASEEKKTFMSKLFGK
jgi:CheY-like chemotaxis protein